MTKLCPRGKAAAKRKFKVYPSAYANAYASKICAGKIKDPSGVKRKDFRGPKPAAKGAMMTAAGGQRKGVKGKSAKELEMDRNYRIKNRRKPNRNIPTGMGIAAPVPAEKRKKITEFRKAGGMTAGSRSALGRIQKANMVKAKRGKFSDQGKSFIKRRMALAGSLPPMGKGPRGMGKIADPKSFIKRRMMLAGPKSVLPSQSDVASKVKRVGKKLRFQFDALKTLNKKITPTEILQQRKVFRSPAIIRNLYSEVLNILQATVMMKLSKKK